MSDNKTTKRYPESPSVRRKNGADEGRKPSDGEIKILRDIANELLALKKTCEQNFIVIKATLEEQSNELKQLRKESGAIKMLGADALKKTTELHTRFITTTDSLGGRLLSLERERGNKRKPTPIRSSSRPPGG